MIHEVEINALCGCGLMLVFATLNWVAFAKALKSEPNAISYALSAAVGWTGCFLFSLCNL